MPVVTEAKKQTMQYSRERKLQHFFSYFKEGQTVLDVGVSSESKKKGWPARNYFLKNYPYDSSTYTGLGVQDLSEMGELFPGKRFVQYSGGQFPFEGKQFDWVFSNAVIEHVGDDEAQILFLNEMMRVAHNVFFTTPNKYFPIESHTNVLMLHWHDGLFYNWCRKNRPKLNRNNLYLFSLKRLKTMLKMSHASSYSIYKNRMLGWPMTFTVICQD